MDRDRDKPRQFASPPCFAHELQFGEYGVEAVDPATAVDVARWRTAKRQELIATRLSVGSDERAAVAADVVDELARIVDPSPATIVSVYWPFRGELDLRSWMKAIHGLGACVCLPVVMAKARPLLFRKWTPDCELERGVWNIPVPAKGKEITPNVVIAPLVGFDPECYRLGYGGGFFDRTLAAMSPRPRVIGVGLPGTAMATIYPQSHDIPMDVIVTGAGKVKHRDGL